MASTSETGLQLFARLMPRPSLVGLDNALFPEGPCPKEVIELVGELSSGKTLLFTKFIATSILPKDWKTLRVGGLKAGVVLLNTDHHFQLYKLISVMENCLSAVSSSFTVTDIQEIIKDSLDRLVIYNITNSVQLQVTLHALQSLVSNEPEIGLILLDSVSAFYWLDVMMSGIQKMDLYVKTVVKTLKKTLGDFKGVIMYTRPDYFQSRASKLGNASVKPGSDVDRKISLKRNIMDDQSIFSAEVESSSERFTRTFKVNTSGNIQWLE